MAFSIGKFLKAVVDFIFRFQQIAGFLSSGLLNLGAEAIPMEKNNVRLQMRLVHNNFASLLLILFGWFILMEQPKHTTNERKTTISEFYEIAILLKRILILSECPVVIHLFHIHEFKV
ncbi:hypothetical protein HID58_072587 [Brassica napus]|uniref:Uncharacterized protein n=1 Tax=Brassica napus TaxID=3708 RepID=A0ABQ7Z4U8_BRANA|nr:hypothetical protein HID58_072587 [Brassica napus]